MSLPSMSNSSRLSYSVTDIFTRYLYRIIKLAACLIVLSFGLKTIWSTLRLINIIAFYSAWCLGLSILLCLLSVFIFGTYPDIQASPEEAFIIECRNRSRTLLPHMMAQDGNSELSDELMVDVEDVIMGEAEELEDIPVLHLSPETDDTAEDINLVGLPSNNEGITMKEEPVFNSNITAEEKTAEDGWIVLHDETTGLYDYDNDPAGLYGGREVEDRPSIVEFLHQDAISKGIFATMAPTEADVAASLVGSRLEAVLGTSEGVFNISQPTSRFRPRIPNVPVIPECQSTKSKATVVPTHILKRPQSYAQALSGLPAPTKVTTASIPIRTSKSNIPSPFSTKKQKRSPRKNVTIFDKLTVRNATTADDQEESDLQKAIRMSLEGPDKAQEDLELQMAMQTFKTDKEKEEADLQKAIRESMRPMFGEKTKPSSVSFAGSMGEEAEFQHELHSAMESSKDGEKRRKVGQCAADGEESKGEKGDGGGDEMACLRIQMHMRDGTTKPRYRF